MCGTAAAPRSNWISARNLIALFFPPLRLSLPTLFTLIIRSVKYGISESMLISMVSRIIDHDHADNNTAYRAFKMINNMNNRTNFQHFHFRFWWTTTSRTYVTGDSEQK